MILLSLNESYVKYKLGSEMLSFYLSITVSCQVSKVLYDWQKKDEKVDVGDTSSCCFLFQQVYKITLMTRVL